MVYQQKLVAAIKYNGKILRELDNNTVYLPFLAEYQIIVKNLETRDVLVNINIDGKDVLDNQSIIIKSNSTVSLDGFLNKNKVSNRFKFIQKTGKIQNNRQDDIEDGLIRIEYRFAKQKSLTFIEPQHIQFFHPHWCECPICKAQRGTSAWFTTQTVTSPFSGSTINVSNNQVQNINNSISDSGSPGVYYTSHTSDVGSGLASQVSSSAFMPIFEDHEDGITVKGSKSDQEFTYAAHPLLEEQSFSIVIRLRGRKPDNQPVEKPILVKTKIKCSTCGRKNKSNFKFCAECGTSLI